jgi:antibiotic biosynthesis monooxygenase
VLVVTRFVVPEEGGERFLADARRALAALAARPGYRSGRVGRAVDDPTAWVVQSEWDGVGAYRRALSAYDVKVDAAPLLGLARDEVSAYEVLVTDDGPSAEEVVDPSARALDADSAAPGRDLG